MFVFTPYIAILTGMAVIMISLIVMAFRHQSPMVKEFYRKCAQYLTYVLILIGFSITCLALEYALISFTVKLFWGTVRFMAFAFLPPAVLRLYLRFSDNYTLTGKRAFLAMHIIPAFTLCMVLTNPLHHLFWTERALITSAYVSFVYNSSGPFFWLHAAYSYTLLMGAYGVLLAGVLKKPRIYRGQGYIMLAGACASLVINAIYIFNIYTDLGDLTMPALFVAAICLYWAIFMHKPVQMIRMARALAVNELDTPVVIFDNKDVLIDANHNAMETLQIEPVEIFNLHVSEFFNRIGRTDTESLDDKEIRLCIDSEKYYNVMDKMLTEKNGMCVGRYIVFNDITHIKNIVKKLEYSNTHDRFTGMYNRNVFQTELKKIDLPESLPIAIIALNIYGMKFLNTVFGYEFGDRMIKLAADAVSRMTEGKGICARVSGDEFMIALRNTSEKEAVEFTRQMLEAARTAGDVAPLKSSVSGNFGTHITLSSGIAVKESRSENIDLIYKNAVSRMFRDKLLNAKTNSDALFKFLQHVLQNNQFETEGHVDRIQQLSLRIAEHMKFTPVQQENLRLLSLTHNIGILNAPVELIKKAGALSNEEWEEVRLHTVRGYNIAMLFPDLAAIADDVLRHHERYDGLGYPNGLKGDEIPIGAQIIQMVNYFDELTHPKPPEKPLTVAEALVKIKKQAGAMFSPALADIFLEVIGSGAQDTPKTIVRTEDDAELAEILKLLNMDAED